MSFYGMAFSGNGALWESACRNPCQQNWRAKYSYDWGDFVHYWTHSVCEKATFIEGNGSSNLCKKGIIPEVASVIQTATQLTELPKK